MKIQTGWYGDCDRKVFVVGLDPSGMIVYLDGPNAPYRSCMFDGLYFRNLKPLPECTGWDWKPLHHVEMANKQQKFKLWVRRRHNDSDRYVFLAPEKGGNDFLEIVFDGTGWTIKEEV